jgi:O-succinylbenzoate synthase
MRVKEVSLRHVKMKLKSPFSTSFGTFEDKDFLLLEAIDANGISGWGESVAFHSPWYNEETTKTNWHILEDFLIPGILNKEIEHPNEIADLFSYIRKNNMAKSTIEGAVWDLYAKNQEIPLAGALGGERKEIEELLHLIDEYVNEGYRRLKVKIKPGWDVEVLREIRKHFPDVPLMADANSAYHLKDIDRLKALDEFGLMMIEQPLASDDIVDHRKLQKEIITPICLDESIHSYEDARKAIELNSCKIINIKIGRVGGLTESKRIHELCQQHNIPVWCGGMLESGIGRAHNIALTTLSNFILPGDTAGSSRYWERDIIDPEVVVTNGIIKVPEKPGIGFEPNREIIQQLTVYESSYS